MRKIKLHFMELFKSQFFGGCTCVGKQISHCEEARCILLSQAVSEPANYRAPDYGLRTWSKKSTVVRNFLLICGTCLDVYSAYIYNRPVARGTWVCDLQAVIGHYAAHFLSRQLSRLVFWEFVRSGACKDVHSKYLINWVCIPVLYPCSHFQTLLWTRTPRWKCARYVHSEHGSTWFETQLQS